MATDDDVITAAFRRMGMGVTDAVTANEMAVAREVYAAQHAELGTENRVPWPPEVVPAEAVIPLAMFLQADIAPSFGMPGGNRGLAKLRCLAMVRPDTRQDDQDVEAEYY
jgi:hypothetical protein